jgi:hypothetical protein
MGKKLALEEFLLWWRNHLMVELLLLQRLRQLLGIIQAKNNR